MTTPTKPALEQAIKNEDNLKTAIQIAKDISTGSYDISAFVEQLGFALTSPTIEDRVNGTKLLSRVLSALPKDMLTEIQLDFLVTFYTDRLKDHHNVIPAVIDGIDALVNMQNLSRQSVPKILQSFFQYTTCQSQLRNDRAKLFKILKFLTEQYKQELTSMKGDFLYMLISSIDGERDPRNLDFIFTFMPDFIGNYSLLHLAEELFEIFACYFPIDFNPSKNDPDTITRDKLAAKLTNCLVATEEFVEWAIALALEKLESDLIVAKLDSMELLNQAAVKFEPKTLEPHFAQIWTALKTEIFPGTDNKDIVNAALKTLCSMLERAASVPDISHNYQTIILGTILTHLCDINHRLFNPATAIAFVCVSGDASYAADKILNSFLLKLSTKMGDNDKAAELCVEDRIKIYGIVANILKIATLRGAIEKINRNICTQIENEVIATLRLIERQDFDAKNLDVQLAALSVLNECVPIISETQRAIIYKLLVQLVTHTDIDLECRQLIIQLGALHPIELQTHFIDVCIRNFSIFSNFIKRKIFANFLPLVPQMAFAQRILELVLTHVFKPESLNDVRLIALEALNTLLTEQDQHFIVELQQQNNLIHKLIELAQQTPLELDALSQLAAVLSLIIQQLEIAEQYAIVTEYLPQLNLQLAADLFIAKGLLGFLHKDISLDDHFERLLNDLTQLSLTSEDAQLRELAHHLLCSLVNKIDYTPVNRSILAKTIATLKTAIKSGDKKAVEVLSWLAKGLIVRGCDEAGEIIEALAELLDHPSLATVATLAFEVISAEYPQLHLPIAKFLYKQKFFHMLLTKLNHKLSSFCANHLNAFIYVLKTTPHAVLKMNIEKLGPILFRCLEGNQVHTLCIALSIIENFVKDQDEYFQSHLTHLIPSCLTLTKFKQSMQVRISALRLLCDLTKYPTFVLLPHKIDVELQLADALDDPKRLVRNIAVTTRNAWFLIGAPNTE